MKFIKEHFFEAIILILLIILIMGRCNKPSPVTEIIKRDTVWIYRDSVIVHVPQLIKTIPVERLIKDTKYIPDTNYLPLLKQYQKLLLLYLEKNIQRDTLKLKNLGYISITDTVENNLISRRVYDYKIKYPEVTNTIIEKRNQLYLGIGLQGEQTKYIHQFTFGLMLKNKKDQLYGASIGINADGHLTYGFSTYFKIKFK